MSVDEDLSEETMIRIAMLESEENEKRRKQKEEDYLLAKRLEEEERVINNRGGNHQERGGIMREEEDLVDKSLKLFEMMERLNMERNRQKYDQDNRRRYFEDGQDIQGESRNTSLLRRNSDKSRNGSGQKKKKKVKKRSSHNGNHGNRTNNPHTNNNAPNNNNNTRDGDDDKMFSESSSEDEIRYFQSPRHREESNHSPRYHDDQPISPRYSQEDHRVSPRYREEQLHSPLRRNSHSPVRYMEDSPSVYDDRDSEESPPLIRQREHPRMRIIEESDSDDSEEIYNIRARSHNNHHHHQRSNQRAPNTLNGFSYEDLLRLDENNVSRGASKSQIRKLQTTIYSKSEDKNCTICLEDFEVGEELYILPCIHKFHTDCLDNWLKRSKICPICRNEIDN